MRYRFSVCGFVATFLLAFTTAARGAVTVANAASPCTVETPYSDNKVVHPSVVDFGYGNTWNGYRYWMAETPYDFNDTDRENPCIHASADGLTWVTPTGLTNPIDPTPDAAYNSDTELIYDSGLGRMECWYREYDGSSTKLHRRYSTDGVTWSAEETIFSAATTTLWISPAIVVWSNGYRQMWFVSSAAGAYAGVVRTCISTDYGATWGDPNGVAVTGEDDDFNPWHIDVTYVSETGELLMLANSRFNTTTYADGDLYCLVSRTGYHWYGQTTPILSATRQAFAISTGTDSGDETIVDAAESSVWPDDTVIGSWIRPDGEAATVSALRQAYPITAWTDPNTVTVTDADNELSGAITDPNCHWYPDDWDNRNLYRSTWNYNPTTGNMDIWYNGVALINSVPQVGYTSVQLYLLLGGQPTHSDAVRDYRFVTDEGSAAYSASVDPNTPASVQNADGGAEAGDTVFLGAGTYSLSTYLETTNSGTYASPVKFVGTTSAGLMPPQGTRPVTLSIGTNDSRVFYIYGEAYWQFANITFAGNAASSNYIVYGNGANGARFLNCSFTNSGRSGYYNATSTVPPEFLGCDFYNTGVLGDYAAIDLATGSELRVSGCTFRAAAHYGVRLRSTVVLADEVLIQKSIFAASTGGIDIAAKAATSDPNIPIVVDGCVFWACGTAINSTVDDPNFTPRVILKNCIFYDPNSTQHIAANATGKMNLTLINCAFGPITAGEAIDTDCNIMLDSTPYVTLTADPFVDAANGDFRLNAYGRLSLAGWPGVMLSQDTNERPGPYQNSHDVTLQPWPGSRIW